MTYFYTDGELKKLCEHCKKWYPPSAVRNEDGICDKCRIDILENLVAKLENQIAAADMKHDRELQTLYKRDEEIIAENNHLQEKLSSSGYRIAELELQLEVIKND